MGWTGIYGPRKAAIEAAKAEINYTDEKRTREIVKGRFVGNHYYCIVRSAEIGRVTETYAVVVLFERRGPATWMWKTMAEHEGPYYHAFPLPWLDELDPLHSGLESWDHRVAWRQRVRGYWSQRGAQVSAAACR